MKQTVKDMLDGKLAFIEPPDYELCLPFIHFIDREAMTKEFAESVGAILGDASTRGPMSVNGRPQYFGGKFVQRDDWPIIGRSYNAELKKRDTQVELVHG